MSRSTQRLSGSYQCHPEDDIKHLRIRVKVWKATSDKQQEETYDFKWQEKIFSMQEIEKYKGPPGAVANELEERYKKMLDEWMRMRHKMLKEHRLYSQVDDEISKEVNEEFLVTDFVDEKLTATEVNFREAQQSYSEDAFAQERGQAPTSQVKLIDHPTREETLRQFFRTPKSLRMRILFDSRPSLKQQQQQPPPDDEQQQQQQQQQQQLEDAAADASAPVDRSQRTLCTLTFNQRDRQLTVTPDFSRQPMIIGNWRYTIENVSNVMSEAEAARAIAQEKERAKLKAEARQLFRQIDFEMPLTPGSLRVIVRGEIVSAAHFQFDDIYVQFFLDLPADWWVNGSAGLSGVTQICSTKTEEVRFPLEFKKNVAFFSYPFEFELNYERTVPQSENDFEFPRWPTMYFEVMSQDAWTRHRTEGYTHLTLPTRPGSHEFRLDCWRPTGDSVVCELRRFFIGGTPALEDPTFAKEPSDFDGSHLSKYGLSTEATGRLKIRLHSVHQSVSLLHRLQEQQQQQQHSLGGGKAAEAFSSAGPSQAELMRALNRFRAARVQLITVQRSSGLTQESPTANGNAGGDHRWKLSRTLHSAGTAGEDQEDEEAAEEEENGSGLLDTRSRVAEQYSRQLREQ